MTPDASSLPPADITGCVLAGGRGMRMGGVDKGLQPFLGQPLAAQALARLAPQVGRLMVNANRHGEEYAGLGARFGAPVWPDAESGYPGPLAGMLSGLVHCETPWLACVPCDTPLFPADLVARLGRAALAARPGADIAIAHGWEASPGTDPHALRAQPVFCLLRASLRDSLQAFIRSGGRKIDAWTAQHRSVAVHFDQDGDSLLAFANANTLQELQALERAAASACPPGISNRTPL
jgi:molybdopterin-guanine dinucleotide biosynthesis protein A